MKTRNAKPATKTTTDKPGVSTKQACEHAWYEYDIACKTGASTATCTGASTATCTRLHRNWMALVAERRGY